MSDPIHNRQFVPGSISQAIVKRLSAVVITSIVVLTQIDEDRR